MKFGIKRKKKICDGYWALTNTGQYKTTSKKFRGRRFPFLHFGWHLKSGVIGHQPHRYSLREDSLLFLLGFCFVKYQ